MDVVINFSLVRAHIPFLLAVGEQWTVLSSDPYSFIRSFQYSLSRVPKANISNTRRQ
jgi:hypothetical protein